ncbi:MAG: hypothetical protein QOJ64_2505 [Acidobacteriota bacterium]|nr:hypothetical protein [Acidobacteriota bacterium]
MAALILDWQVVARADEDRVVVDSNGSRGMDASNIRKPSAYAQVYSASQASLQSNRCRDVEPGGNCFSNVCPIQ